MNSLQLDALRLFAAPMSPPVRLGGEVILDLERMGLITTTEIAPYTGKPTADREWVVEVTPEGMRAIEEESKRSVD